jgi:hypothetical protein
MGPFTAIDWRIPVRVKSSDIDGAVMVEKSIDPSKVFASNNGTLVCNAGRRTLPDAGRVGRSGGGGVRTTSDDASFSIEDSFPSDKSSEPD